MNRPEALNASNREMQEGMTDAWIDFRDDPEMVGGYRHWRGRQGLLRRRGPEADQRASVEGAIGLDG